MAKKEVLEMEIKANTKSVTKDVEKLDKATDKAKGGFEGIGTSIKGMGVALKAAGIGVIVGLFAKLMEVFSKNQKVVDVFNSSMTALSIAFNDLFGFISNNVGNMVSWFQDIFENPRESLESFATAIKNNLIERFQSLLDMVGHLGTAIGHLFKGEFAAAKEAAVEAGKEMVDVWTGVDDSVDKASTVIKNATTAIVDYTKATYDQAAAITATQKAADRAAVEFDRLNAQYLKDAEIQRQIRDDETRTFEDRIAANEELNNILEKQQKLQKEQVQKQIDAAQAQYKMNESEENFIALQTAKNELLAVEETITGQLSEQKTNAVALEKELFEVKNELLLSTLEGIDLELQELQLAYEQKVEMARKAGVDTAAITEKYENDKAKIIMDNNKTIKKAAQMTAQSNLQIASTTAANMAKILGEETKAGKAMAITQATIDTYKGATAAYSAMAGIPYVGPALGAIAAAAAIASGIANVKAIASTGEGGGGGGISAGGGGGGGVSANTPAPQMMSGSFELQAGVAPEPVKAFVVTDEMTNSQDQLSNIRRRATI